MSNMESAIERIKRLECPTGDLGYRVAGILEDYEVVNRSQVKLSRDKKLDKDGAEGYSAKIPNNKGQALVVLATSGMDDYVAKVVDAYIQ